MLQALESAAFSAWPAQRSLDVQGWHLRLDRGYTKRANSANATAQSRPLTANDVESIEAHFRLSGLTPTFRLTSFAPIEDSDRLLGSRGYRSCDASLVMTRSLAGGAGLGHQQADAQFARLLAVAAGDGEHGDERPGHSANRSCHVGLSPASLGRPDWTLERIRRLRKAPSGSRDTAAWNCHAMSACGGGFNRSAQHIR